MNSLTRLLTPKSLLVQLRMERQKHKGVFFLIEGSTDFKRFEKFVDLSVVSLIPCGGKQNVLDLIELVQNSSYEDCLAFVDSDFDRIACTIASNDDIIYSNYHDFDMDICHTPVIERYLKETGDSVKITAEGGTQVLLSNILKALQPLSALRYANVKHNLKYKLNSINLWEFFDGTTIDVTKMIDHVSTGSFSSSAHKAALQVHISRYSSPAFDLSQFTNGHDLIAAIGIALRSRIGSRQICQTLSREVEIHLRLAFDYSDFHHCGLAQKIVAWQAGRHDISIIKLVA